MEVKALPIGIDNFEKREKDNSYLFENLNIMKSGENYTSHMGQYPVINLSLKSAKQPNFDLAYICIKVKE